MWNPCPQKSRRPYDWIINGHRVAVKFAFESKDDEWTFNQIRVPDKYDYLCCMGILPSNNKIDGKSFIFNKEEVFNFYRFQNL